jgi:acetyltransferase-like isoleucine patch superfamily enzyme
MNLIEKLKLKCSMFLKISIFKTLNFNLYYLPSSQAINIPILIPRNVKIFPLKGNIKIDAKVSTGMIKIGLRSIPMFNHSLSYKTLFRLAKGPETIFRGKFEIYNGTKITSGGKLSFGNNFVIIGNSSIICDNQIDFGNDFLMSWECQLLDNDFHKVIIDGIKKLVQEPIQIGNKVWIRHHVIIKKGVKISDNSVVSYGSVVTKKFNKPNVLIGSVPAKIIKNNVSWEE